MLCVTDTLLLVIAPKEGRTKVSDRFLKLRQSSEDKPAPLFQLTETKEAKMTQSQNQV